MTERKANNEMRERTYVRYPWWSYVKGLLMQYGWALAGKPHILTDDQMDAICRAIDAAMELPNGEQIMRVASLVLIKKTHTIAGAAMTIPVCEDTAKLWHRNFIRAVARELGLSETAEVRRGGAILPTSAENL